MYEVVNKSCMRKWHSTLLGDCIGLFCFFRHFLTTENGCRFYCAIRTVDLKNTGNGGAEERSIPGNQTIKAKLGSQLRAR
jgi:hypothetical protein